jgi:hypothetical protein
LANCQSIAAFYTDQAIQVAAQDLDTGNILYSSCNSVGTPVFPIDSPNVLSTKRTPRNGTALTMAGWFDKKKIVVGLGGLPMIVEIANGKGIYLLPVR